MQQAHIHFGASGLANGIAVFLCTNLGNGPAGTQPCPAPPATISGTATAADVIGPMPQGIEPGAFGEVIAAMRAGVAYANVHSMKWPGRRDPRPAQRRRATISRRRSGSPA